MYSTRFLRHNRKTDPRRPTCSLALGHPFRGTHKKRTESDEQELREFMRLKHHSHGLKNQYFG